MIKDIQKAYESVKPKAKLVNFLEERGYKFRSSSATPLTPADGPGPVNPTGHPGAADLCLADSDAESSP